MPATRAPADEPLVVLVSTRAVLLLPDDSLVLSPATILVSPATGKILSIFSVVLSAASFDSSVAYFDYSPSILLPGLVDAHVHLNEPGRTEWEGFDTGTKAAAAGGVTTVVDMPLNAIPPTTTLAGFQQKLAASHGHCWVDVAFYGGMIPGNVHELLPLVEAGVRGFKGFLIESGVEEFPAVTSQDIALAMSTLKDTPTTLMFHAEMIPPNGKPVSDEASYTDLSMAPNGKPTSYNTFLESRPPVFETYAVENILSLAKIAPRLHLHIVHLSATECIPILQAARARGINITAETCFHYLALASEDIEDGDTRHKCCPPIRSRTNQDRLWAELNSPNSCVQTVVSDHSPCTPELKLLPGHLQVLKKGRENKALAMAMNCADSNAYKTLPTNMVAGSEMKKARGDFLAAWGGISSVGLGLPILHSAASTRTLSGEQVPSIVDMVRLCCQATARQVGLSHRKGGLKEGMDADVCVFDETAEWTLDIGGMRWKNKCSPWEGYKFMGRVKETWLRGVKVFQLNGPNQGFIGGKPEGEAILEKRFV